MTDSTPTASTQDEEWFGHPRGLFYLFFAEMWERFCFYGMRNILVLYMISYFAYTKKDAQNGPYAAYTALIYCVALGGGYIADRYLGYRKSIMYGGIMMAVGMFMMLVNNDLLKYVGMEVSRSAETIWFFGAMATIIMGNGFFKPNISTIVGKLYAPGDPRRDGGFTIFYMGINVGAFVGGIACGYLGEKVSWPLGFGLAAIGMLSGVWVFGSKGCTRSLKGHGDPKDPDLAKRSWPLVLIGSLASIPVFYYLLRNSAIVGYILGATGVVVFVLLLGVALKEDKVQREKIYALFVLLGFNMVFWAFFEQAGSSLTVFAKENLNRSVLSFEMPASWAQNFNALFIVLFAPVLAALWVMLGKKGREPSIPTKFSLGLLQLGMGFGILAIGAKYFSTAGMTPLVFIVLLYFMNTTGELFLSPVGLSMVTKLAPERMTGMVMGTWFLSIAGANFLAGQIAALTGGEESVAKGASEATLEANLQTYGNDYEFYSYLIMGAAALLLLLVPQLKKWMHDVR